MSERLKETILARLRDYARSDMEENRRLLVEAWRLHHPEAAAEASAGHRTLDLLHSKQPGEPADFPDEVWASDLFQVTLRRVPDRMFRTIEGIIQLGISTNAGTARHDWREFQWIKNQLAGPECEAFELYPAESRLLDPSNYYTLWCFPGLKRLRVGIEDRTVYDAWQALAPQRAFDVGVVTDGT